MKSLPMILAMLLVTYALADELKQPRTLGNLAVMHVYYYSPDTLEITYVDSHLFKTAQACMDAIPQALTISWPYVNKGDLLTAQCAQIQPPHDPKHHPRAETVL